MTKEPVTFNEAGKSDSRAFYHARFETDGIGNGKPIVRHTDFNAQRMFLADYVVFDGIFDKELLF